MKKIILVIALVSLLGGSSYIWMNSNSTNNDSKLSIQEEVSELTLNSDGLGTILFGTSEAEVIAPLTSLLGNPEKDTGWIDSFSSYGTCPGDQIRVLEWGKLKIFIGDTKYGSKNFFQYAYTGRDTEDVTQHLSTSEGITLDITKDELLSLHPNTQLTPTPWGSVDFKLSDYPNYLGGSLVNYKVFWIEAGIQCGD